MDLRRLWKRARRIWITLGVSATIIFVTWSLIAYRASSEARQAAESDSVVFVDHSMGVWSFSGKQLAVTPPTVLVFFPGALVDPRAYAPLARAAALGGFRAFIIELPRRGAFGGADDPVLDSSIESVLRRHDPATNIVIAGHSRGAVVASRIASRAASRLAGLILIGTSHPRDVDLSGLSMPVVKIVGTHDGLASRGEVEENAAKLPATTRWIWVEGGNHSQFGWYGFQPGDWPAAIEPSVQRQVMIDAVLEMLRQVTTTAEAGSRRAS